MDRRQLPKKDVWRYPLNLETFFTIRLWLVRNTKISTGITLMYSSQNIMHERWILSFLGQNQNECLGKDHLIFERGEGGVCTRPRVFLPPGDPFSAQTTENRQHNRACPMGSPVKSNHALSSPTKFPLLRLYFKTFVILFLLSSFIRKSF